MGVWTRIRLSGYKSVRSNKNDIMRYYRYPDSYIDIDTESNRTCFEKGRQKSFSSTFRFHWRVGKR